MISITARVKRLLRSYPKKIYARAIFEDEEILIKGTRWYSTNEGQLEVATKLDTGKFLKLWGRWDLKDSGRAFSFDAALPSSEHGEVEDREFAQLAELLSGSNLPVSGVIAELRAKFDSLKSAESAIRELPWILLDQRIIPRFPVVDKFAKNLGRAKDCIERLRRGIAWTLQDIVSQYGSTWTNFDHLLIQDNAKSLDVADPKTKEALLWQEANRRIRICRDFPVRAVAFRWHAQQEEEIVQHFNYREEVDTEAHRAEKHQEEGNSE